MPPPPAPVVITPVRPGDWPHLKRVRLAALADTPLAFGVTLADTEALTDADWQERARPRAGKPLSVRFLAFQADEPVGIMGVFTQDEGEFAGLPMLFSVWVDPVLRGTDVADRLLSATVDWGRGTGADRMLLWVWTANARARRFYERNGWRPTGRTIAHVLDASHTESEYELPL